MNEFIGNMDITAKGCNLYYGDFHALKNINIEIPEKQVTALIGPSGCGKSTFLKIFNRMNDLVEGCRIEGEYRIGGVDIFDKETDVNVLRKNVGMKRLHYRELAAHFQQLHSQATRLAGADNAQVLNYILFTKVPTETIHVLLKVRE